MASTDLEGDTAAPSFGEGTAALFDEHIGAYVLPRREFSPAVHDAQWWPLRVLTLRAVGSAKVAKVSRLMGDGHGDYPTSRMGYS